MLDWRVWGLKRECSVVECRLEWPLNAGSIFITMIRIFFSSMIRIYDKDFNNERKVSSEQNTEKRFQRYFSTNLETPIKQKALTAQGTNPPLIRSTVIKSCREM